MSDAVQLGILETKVETLSASVGDHELRIRANEKIGYKMLAIAFAGASLGGAVTMLIAFLATL